jgi:hypothetical protein
VGEQASADARLDARYGRTPKNPGRSWWFAGAGIACAGAAVAWYAWAGPGVSPSAVDGVHAEVSGTSIADAHHVNVTFTVNGPAGRTISCALNAKTQDFTIVGWKVVEIPPSARQSRTFTQVLRTTQPAEAGFVDSCWLT